MILEDQNFTSPKTSEFLTLLENLKVSDKKTLFVVTNEERNVYLSSRNLKKTKVVSVDKLNTYEILNAETLILAEGTIEKIENLFNV